MAAPLLLLLLLLLLTDCLAAECVECSGHAQDDVPAEVPPLQPAAAAAGETLH
jgi:hypothetical protein